MYQPSMFKEKRTDILVDAMRDIRFACMVTSGSDGLHATHVPALVKSGADGVAIEFHVARGNPHWRLAENAAETLCIFQGPQAYIHPGWYASKAEHGKVVPTWCYVTVHAHGRLEVIAEHAELRSHLEGITTEMEASREKPWAVDDAPRDHIEKLMRAIVGLRVRVDRLEGAYKLNQNKPAADRAGAVDGLLQENKTDAQTIAQLMKDASADLPD